MNATDATRKDISLHNARIRKAEDITTTTTSMEVTTMVVDVDSTEIATTVANMATKKWTAGIKTQTRSPIGSNNEKTIEPINQEKPLP